MCDENEFQMGKGMGIMLENEYGYGYRYGHGFLKLITDCVSDLLVKYNQNTVKSKHKC